jgi:hypothetical protein
MYSLSTCSGPFPVVELAIEMAPTVAERVEAGR